MAASLIAGCWAGQYTYESCCVPHPDFHPVCWAQVGLTPELCCGANVSAPSARRLASRRFSTKNIQLFTVETRDSRSHIELLGAPGYVALNIGAGVTWRGFSTRASLVAEWLRVEALRDPTRLVIFLETIDMIAGGCEENDLLDVYRSTVAASDGARVVFGAEFGLQSPLLAEPWHYEAFEARRRSVLDATLPPRPASEEGQSGSGWPYSFAFTCPKHWLQEWRDVAEKALALTCDSPAYRYINGGFIMGPVGNLYELFKDPNVHRATKRYGCDQSAAVEYMFNHTRAVTLDYSGRLSLSLFGFNAQVPLGLGADGRLFNTVAGGPVCFVHSNGNAKYTFQNLMGRIAAALNNPVAYGPSSAKAHQRP
eukprot:TRINITY_DN56423_c0_g1_i1.p1 TRINITY_DN56423_c0_g1~~TRINITY_DN56423_c0_g1_i1.p1  ORF type:complete len:392 (+),score=21.27 TRINITY_DN56423_c0_g1_i1:73-1176(+)